MHLVHFTLLLLKTTIVTYSYIGKNTSFVAIFRPVVFVALWSTFLKFVGVQFWILALVFGNFLLENLFVSKGKIPFRIVKESLAFCFKIGLVNFTFASFVFRAFLLIF